MSARTTSVPLMQAFPGGPARKIRRGDALSFMSDEDLGRLTVSAISSGTTVATDAVAGGGMVITGNTDADDSGANWQWDATPIKLSSKQSLRAYTQVAISEVTQSDLWFGVGVSDASLVASAPADFVGFVKADGSASLTAYSRRDSGTAVTQALVTMVAGQLYDLAIETFVDDSTGKGRTVFMVDGAALHTIDHTVNILSEEFCTIEGAFQTGAITLGAPTCRHKFVAFDIDP
jgi:hypothetical protein